MNGRVLGSQRDRAFKQRDGCQGIVLISWSCGGHPQPVGILTSINEMILPWIRWVFVGGFACTRNPGICGFARFSALGIHAFE